MADVTGVDVEGSAVVLADGSYEAYDYLILATGSAYGFFGHDEWQPHVFVLKSLEDALAIRTHLLGRFEAATRSDDDTAIAKLLTFVIVGGGPTGVELAGTIAEFSRSILPRDFASLRPDVTRIILCEGASRLLTGFTEAQSAFALKTLRSLGVDVRLGDDVKEITAGCVKVGGETIVTATVLWCAGTKARPAAEWLGVEASKHCGVPVAANCSVPSKPDIFVLGDTATFKGKDRKPLPGLAAVAKQQGRLVAELLNARIAGKTESSTFRYRDWGTLAVIGRSRAVATFGDVHLTGFVAWLSWALIHLALLVDFRSRILVYVNWAWEWLHSNRGVRLIIRPADAKGGRPATPGRSAKRAMKKASATGT